MRASIVMSAILVSVAGQSLADMNAASAFSAGKQFSESQTGPAAAQISSGRGSEVVPNYTDTSPEVSYFGGGNGYLGGYGQQKLTTCASGPNAASAYNQQECDAVNFLSKNPQLRLKFNIEKTDPLVTQGVAVNKNPGAVLGPMGYDPGGSYSACTPKTVTTPAQYSTQNCTIATGLTSQSCTYGRVVEIQDDANFECEQTVSAYETVSCDRSLNAVVTVTQMMAAVKKSCPSGTMVGNYCVATTSTSASPYYSCQPGYSLSGTTCSTTITNTSQANFVGYSCPSGYSNSGSSCTKSTTTTVGATATYSCSSGTLSGTSCVTTQSTTATPSSWFCTTGTLVVEGESRICRSTSTTAATSTTTYSCSGGSLAGTTCLASAPLSDIWACPSVYPGSSTTIIYDAAYCAWSATPSTTYSCPGGGTLSGTSCATTTTTQAIIGSYTCPSGYTLSGTSCTKTTVSGATVSYSCPSDMALTGTNCTKTTTTTVAATPVYSCPTGQTLSGSNCISTTNVSTPATIAGYTCPSGYVLSGTTCTLTETTSVVIEYSCIDGSTPVNGVCTLYSYETGWSDGCSQYESNS